IRPTIETPRSVVDARSESPAARDDIIARARLEQVTTPFDLVNGPLVRSAVIRLSDDEHYVLFCVHHVIADGWSCGVLLRDLGDLYAARQTGRPARLEPAQQLSEFISFLPAPDQIEARAASRDSWLTLCGGAP